MTTEQKKDIDLLDILSIITGAIVVAMFVSSGGSLIIGFPMAIITYIQHAVRRTALFESWIDHISNPTANRLAREVLLPAPKEDESMALTLHQTKPLDVNVINSSSGGSLFQRMTNPQIGEEQSVITGVLDRNTVQKQAANMNAAIRKLPKLFDYKLLPNPPVPLAVPIGTTTGKDILWADFGYDLDTKILHSLIAGYTGSGKDSLLRLWFATLTMNNTPDDIQFVFIDGKVDWLSPALAESAYMAIPPAGGMHLQQDAKGKWVDIAREDMERSFAWIFNEIHKRQVAFSQIGAIDLASYYKKTGIKLPLLFFIASDVGETFELNLKMLTNLLIMKGRSYGVRLIISMQNPVGEATKWRSQIGMIMTGHQPLADHDRYVLGINVQNMLYRPSLLPNPEDNEIARGLFIVRRGSSQFMVRAPYMPDDDWFEYIEHTMTTKDVQKSKKANLLLDSLLSSVPTPVTKSIAVIPPVEKKTTRLLLTVDQINEIQLWTMRGMNKTEIMIDLLHATNGNTYRELSPSVDRIITATKERMTHGTHTA